MLPPHAFYPVFTYAYVATIYYGLNFFHSNLLSFNCATDADLRNAGADDTFRIVVFTSSVV
jgi:hypothetical protein